MTINKHEKIKKINKYINSKIDIVDQSSTRFIKSKITYFQIFYSVKQI